MITIYTLPNCEHCQNAKDYFDNHNMEYKEVNMKKGGNKGTIKMKKKFKELNIDTAPIIVIDEDIIIPNFDKDILEEILRKKNAKENKK